LAPGYRADLVAFEPSGVEVLETWVAGEPAREPHAVLAAGR
jgi:N-acetylglucosamine-6-phosphate deacetylase